VNKPHDLRWLLKPRITYFSLPGGNRLDDFFPSALDAKILLNCFKYSLVPLSLSLIMSQFESGNQ